MGPWEMIAAERVRQQTEEGYSPEHDAEHTNGQLALLAAAYALESLPNLKPEWARYIVSNLKDIYGWEVKPKNPIRNLVRAGALILAELERLLRKNGADPGTIFPPEKS